MAPSTKTAELRDAKNYLPRESDLAFVGVSADDLDQCARQLKPLGMSLEQFGEFSRTLLEALAREGIASADVRLQGSSVRFFSSPHKTMAYTRDQVFGALMDELRTVPASIRVDHTVREVERVWPPSQERPHQRPFDSYHRLGIAKVPSDYDVQISSDDAVTLLEMLVGERGVSWEHIESNNATYRFIRKELSEQFLYLQAWTAFWEGELGRGVSIALFDSHGPVRPPDTAAEMSSHFKESDWKVHQGAVKAAGR